MTRLRWLISYELLADGIALLILWLSSWLRGHPEWRGPRKDVIAPLLERFEVDACIELLAIDC